MHFKDLNHEGHEGTQRETTRAELVRSDHLKNNRRSALLCILCLVCAANVRAQKVRVEYNKKQDFSGFKTYSWMKPSANAHPFIVMDITGEVDKQLQAKGLTKVDSNADLLVNANGALDGKLNVSYDVNIYAMPGLDGPWWDEGDPGAMGHGSGAVLIDQGTLVIDLVERTAKKLRWRGVAQANLDPDQQEKTMEIIEKAIIKMFHQYPSK
jgi:Domain of unknown function (DUF4136)